MCQMKINFGEAPKEPVGETFIVSEEPELFKTFEEAKNTAKAWAVKYPDEIFYVSKLIGSAKAKGPSWYNY